ncbi:MAG: ClpXP protease specificity-enhancing factor SspB [Acidobacteriota bacterium]
MSDLDSTLTEGFMTEKRLDYPAMVQQALRSVVRGALAEVAERGLPGDHHFYLGFRTDHPGVLIPNFLRTQHPEEMTIVLQHQFSGLMVDSESFAVSLSFGGAWHSLTVPFIALTSFSDPEAQFMLQLVPDFPRAESREDSDEDQEESLLATSPRPKLAVVEQPKTQDPETQAPETQVPETQGAETQVPETQGAEAQRESAETPGDSSDREPSLAESIREPSAENQIAEDGGASGRGPQSGGDSASDDSEGSAAETGSGEPADGAREADAESESGEAAAQQAPAKKAGDEAEDNVLDFDAFRRR